MSLADELRAQKLGSSTEDGKALSALARCELGAIRSESGCDMLMVYLLSRWTSLFQPGRVAEIAASEAFHRQVVDAYLGAGCAINESLPARALQAHAHPGFRNHIELKGKLSPHSFVQLLLRELHPDMFPAVYEQLQRLQAQLEEPHRGTLEELPSAELSEASAFVVRGVRTLVEGKTALREARKLAETHDLSLVVGGDVENLPDDASFDLVTGHTLAAAGADDGEPSPIGTSSEVLFNAQQDAYLRSLGDVRAHLVASGPLASQDGLFLIARYD